MKKHKPDEVFPVSQRELAAYLGISATLLSMTKTGRHGDRGLTTGPSKKMEDLVVAHQQSQQFKAQTVIKKRMEDSSARDCARLAKLMLQDADHADAHVTILKRRLDEMTGNEQQDLHWMNTVDLLLANLPKNKESARDRVWLENQQEMVLSRLQKNGRPAQVKLEAQLEMEKARARIYRDMEKKLRKK